MSARPPLTERKRQRARRRIEEAAGELFDARGFDRVSVTDIAAAAEVGRTTFFRYFGDKQEVVFAKHQELLDVISAAGDATDPSTDRTLSGALQQLQPVVLELCAMATADPGGYIRHYELVDRHVELQARDALKLQQLAGALRDLLLRRGYDEPVARLAAELAVACHRAPRASDNDPATLAEQTRDAFTRVLSLGSA